MAGRVKGFRSAGCFLATQSSGRLGDSGEKGGEGMHCAVRNTESRGEGGQERETGGAVIFPD